MKKSAKMVIAAGAVILSAIVTNPAHAIFYCEAAQVTKVGVYPDLAPDTSTSYQIKIKCPEKWGATAGERGYYLSTSVGEAGLAAALTALSTGKTARVEIASDQWNSIMTGISVNSD
ncbi:MAG: hypothetical protein D3914_04760 [Candidatus Electrothrix sp. LOE2]|nr:hypothetical protein [Candidatus Electrothrix sp. LOE2]